MICPICQHASDQIFQKEGCWIRKCRNCHHRFAEVTPSPDHLDRIYQDGYFMGGAAGYPDYLREGKILSAHGARYGHIINDYTAPGVLLDVGSAAGFILKGFQESGWRGIGLEPNLSMANYGRTHFGFQIENCGLEQFSSNQQFDLVSMIQVIPHFFDIRQALQKAADVTRAGGFWLIETWDRESWVAHILGESWHEYSPPSVLHWFSIEGLKLLASQFGFLEIARGRPSKRISGAHAKSLLGYKLQNSRQDWVRNGLKIIPDHLTIPYPAFDLFWILFQKSTVLDS